MTGQNSRKPVKPQPQSRWKAPFLWIEWCLEWLVYWAGNLAIFQVLEYAGKLTILAAVIIWIVEIPQRRQAQIQNAWSVVSTKGGGRREALEYLVNEKVDLRGLNGEYGYFGSMKLQGLDLRWADLSNANFDGANLSGVNLEGAELDGASFVGADLRNANLRYCSLSSMDPTTRFERARIGNADFRDLEFPGLGSAYLYESIASAIDWKKAKFDEHVQTEIQAYSGN